MDQETEDFYLNLCDKTLANAEQFLKESLLLHKRKSFGHAYSLAVLGFEELAKTWLGINLLFGIYQNTDEEIKKMFKDHKIKHIKGWESFSILFNILWFRMFLETKYKDKISEKMADSSISNYDFDNHFTDLLHEMLRDKNKNIRTAAKNRLQLEEILQQFRDNPRIMDDKKQVGFYVDADINARVITSPLDFPANKDFINTLKWFLGITKEIVGILKKQNGEHIYIFKFIRFARETMRKVREEEISFQDFIKLFFPEEYFR